MKSPSAASKTYVRYHVPHDGDTEEHPNVFAVRKPASEMRLRDIRDAFPLPGQYLFRFKTQFNKTHVWLDLTDDDAAVPRFDGAIVAKVARLSFSGEPIAATPAPSLPSRPSASAPRRVHAAATAARTKAAGRSPVAAVPATAKAVAPNPVVVTPTSGSAGEGSSEKSGGGGGFSDGDLDLLGSVGDDATGAVSSASATGDHGDFEGLWSDEPTAAAPPPAAAAAAAAVTAPMGASQRRNPASTAFSSAAMAPAPGSRGSKAASSSNGDFADLVDM